MHQEMTWLKGLFTPETIRNPKLFAALYAYLNSLEMLGFGLALQQQEEEYERKARRTWVWPYLQRRMEHGHYDNLMRELADECPEIFKNYTRMSKTLFNEIVEAITPKIERKTTWWRQPIPPGLRVAITLRYLATGDSYKTLGYAFRVASNTISLIVPDTCRAIISVYGDTELKLPQSPEEWKEVAHCYEERWNLPHCIGAMDGKHIRIRNPALAGSHYFNYKKYFSMVLLAIVDANYMFMYVDIGAIGSESDGGVFAQTKFADLLERQEAHLPQSSVLPKDPTGPATEYFFVGDDAFPLRTYLMKPYPNRACTKEERIFNYRLSRARLTVENAFGIMANRFRVFHTSICLKPENAESVVMACCILHNILRRLNVTKRHQGDYEDPVTHEIIEGAWRTDPPMGEPLQVPYHQSRTRATQSARTQRNYLKEYCNSPQGAVPWQNKSIS